MCVAMVNSPLPSHDCQEKLADDFANNFENMIQLLRSELDHVTLPILPTDPNPLVAITCSHSHDKCFHPCDNKEVRK